MSLSVTQVRIRDFRSYQEYTLDLDPDLTILVGPNAAGKTNLIEAIELLTEADSFRHPSWTDTVRDGSPGGAKLALHAAGDNRVFEVELDISATGRRVYRVNGKTRRAVNQVAGVLPCVVFTPDDLRIVKDSAERRRAALDTLGSQLSPTYSRLRTDYEKIVRQRNTALREEVDPEFLAVWTDRLIEVGSSLSTHRQRLFGRLKDSLESIYGQLADDGPLDSTYLPSWVRDGCGGSSDEPEAGMRAHLLLKGNSEVARKTTLIGPHRDDLVFSVAGREARAFASQGQQRTIALAWKLAEVSVITDIASQKPVLLLDDVMSELDERRRHALASFAGSVAQTVMTTTNLGYFEKSLLGRAKVVVLQ